MNIFLQTSHATKDFSRGYVYPITIIGVMFLFRLCYLGKFCADSLFANSLRVHECAGAAGNFCFLYSYFVMAAPSGFVLKKLGYKNSLSAGLFIIAVGSLLFIPAALQRNYGIFLIGLFVQGLGLTILQTAANPYVSILGPKESGARRMSIMGICNGVAGIIAPLILGSIVLDDAEIFLRR